MKERYMQNFTTVSSLRCASYYYREVQNIWSCLLNSVDVVKDWLAWKPGNGLEIQVGEDPIIGKSNLYILFGYLVVELRSK